jgi:pyruvate kinase
MEEQRQPARKTKIIVTLGSSSCSVEVLKALILGGMDMARISELYITDKQVALDNLRTAVRETGIAVGVMLGLRESDMRVSSLASSPVLELDKGRTVHITTSRDHLPSECTIFCNNTELPKLVQPGDRLLIDFGKVALRVVSLECDADLRPHDKTKQRYSKYSAPVQKLISLIVSRPVQKALDDRQIQLRPTKVRPPPAASIARLKRPPKQLKPREIVICTAEHSSTLVGSKPLHISPHDGRPQPVSYIKDLEDLRNIRWAIHNKVDVIVFKQIMEPSDLLIYSSSEYRSFAGLQNKESVAASGELVEVTDGCVIGRGMMALETSLSEVCKVQKDLTKLCNHQAKPMVISTQLLESMCVNTVPKGSEINDITNAILDGADALLLSGETAFGRHPTKALEVCSNICLEVERSQEYARISALALEECAASLNFAEDICYCAVQSVLSVGAVLIICITQRGTSAQVLSKFKPPCPILALTDNPQTQKYLRIIRGVVPALMQDFTNDFLANSLMRAKELKLAQAGDLVVYIGGGSDSFATGDTCTLRISQVPS